MRADERPCAQSAECVEYLAELRKRVHRKWYPFGATSGRVELMFQLSPDGGITDLSIVRGSGRGRARAGLDDSAETAFLAAAPFAPPPPQIASKRLRLTFGLGGS